jgi:uncharacterized protein YdaU (DUF1376 family)
MKYPYMPLFWGDFLANTMDLSAQEAGAYLFLIAHAWEHDGKIPSKPVRLARIAHVRQDQWKKVWDALEHFFETTRGGPSISRTIDQWYTHGRVVDELHRLGKISNKRKEAVKQKYNKSSTNGGANAPTNASTSTFITNRESSSNDKQDAAREHAPNFCNKDDDRRYPPPTKSNNVLKPIPDKQAIRRAQKQPVDNKSSEQNSPQQLAAKSAKSEE